MGDKDDRALPHAGCYQPVQQLPHSAMQRHRLRLQTTSINTGLSMSALLNSHLAPFIRLHPGRTDSCAVRGL